MSRYSKPGFSDHQEGMPVHQVAAGNTQEEMGSHLGVWGIYKRTEEA